MRSRVVGLALLSEVRPRARNPPTRERRARRGARGEPSSLRGQLHKNARLGKLACLLHQGPKKGEAVSQGRRGRPRVDPTRSASPRQRSDRPMSRQAGVTNFRGWRSGLEPAWTAVSASVVELWSGWVDSIRSAGLTSSATLGAGVAPPRGLDRARSPTAGPGRDGQGRQTAQREPIPCRCVIVTYALEGAAVLA